MRTNRGLVLDRRHLRPSKVVGSHEQTHGAVVFGRPNAPSIIEGEAATILVDFRGFREDVAESIARVLVAVQGVDFLAVSIRESERMQVRAVAAQTRRLVANADVTVGVLDEAAKQSTASVSPFMMPSIHALKSCAFSPS